MLGSSSRLHFLEELAGSSASSPEHLVEQSQDDPALAEARAMLAMDEEEYRRLQKELAAVRNECREMCEANFVEVYVEAPLEVVEDRDTKGLYKKARAGEIKNFTGVSDPYEAPSNPEVTVHTGNESIEESAEKILAYLVGKGLVADAAAAK